MISGNFHWWFQSMRREITTASCARSSIFFMDGQTPQEGDDVGLDGSPSHPAPIQNAGCRIAVRTFRRGRNCQQLCIGEPTASYLVDRLVQAELVERAEDPADRRRAMIRLSVEGRILLDKLIGPRNWLDDQLRNLDGEDLAALRRGIGAVVAMLESQDGKSNGGEACLT